MKTSQCANCGGAPKVSPAHPRGAGIGGTVTIICSKCGGGDMYGGAAITPVQGKLLPRPAVTPRHPLPRKPAPQGGHEPIEPWVAELLAPLTVKAVGMGGAYWALALSRAGMQMEAARTALRENGDDYSRAIRALAEDQGWIERPAAPLVTPAPTPKASRLRIAWDTFGQTRSFRIDRAREGKIADIASGYIVKGEGVTQGTLTIYWLEGSEEKHHCQGASVPEVKATIENKLAELWGVERG